METEKIKIMALRRDDVCGCGTELTAGTQAGWDRSRRTVICLGCLRPDKGQVDPLDPRDDVVEVGTPGASLQRTYESRKARHEHEVMTKHPKIGRLVLRLQGTKHTTQAFGTGAEGERRVADALRAALGDEVLFLFNRRLSTSERHGDIDLIAIAASGVHVIDAKHYPGRRIRSDRRRDVLVIDGRRRPKLAPGLERQVASVQASIDAGAVDATALAAFCFVAADLPWGRLSVDGLPVRGLRRTRKALTAPGPLTTADRQLLHGHLARMHPPA